MCSRYFSDIWTANQKNLNERDHCIYVILEKLECAAVKRKPEMKFVIVGMLLL